MIVRIVTPAPARTRKGNRVTASGPDYAIARTVALGPRRIAVADAITNRHKDPPLGLCVRHEMDLDALKDASIRLAGNPGPAISDYISFGNPTVHIVTPEGGLGLVMAELAKKPTSAPKRPAYPTYKR